MIKKKKAEILKRKAYAKMKIENEKGKQQKQQDQQNQKRALAGAFKGVVYLVLVMLGIFGVTSLVKMTGLLTNEQEAEVREEQMQWEEMKRIKEANEKLQLKKETAKNEGIALLPLEMHLNVLEYDGGVLKLELDNQTGTSMKYREIWEVAFEENGDFRKLGVIYTLTADGSSAEHAEPTILMDLTKVTLICDLNTLGELQPGNYRITMDNLETEFTLEEGEQ